MVVIIYSELPFDFLEQPLQGTAQSPAGLVLKFRPAMESGLEPSKEGSSESY